MIVNAPSHGLSCYLQLGNPMGGLMYSTAFSSGNATYQQIESWNMFVSCKGAAPDH
jgi:hypothetical protein